jgi:hypothetical protein
VRRLYVVAGLISAAQAYRIRQHLLYVSVKIHDGALELHTVGALQVYTQGFYYPICMGLRLPTVTAADLKTFYDGVLL